MHKWQNKLQAQVTCTQIIACVGLQSLEPRMVMETSFIWFQMSFFLVILLQAVNHLHLHEQVALHNYI